MDVCSDEIRADAGVSFQQFKATPHVCGTHGDGACQASCPWYSHSGNTFHCQHHLGAVHVCDQVRAALLPACCLPALLLPCLCPAPVASTTCAGS